MRPPFFTDRHPGRQFPTLLRDAGVEVFAHDDLFPHTTPDDKWLPRAGQDGWVALFALSGSGRTPELAELVVQNLAAVERFLDRHPPPFLATVLPPPTRRRTGPSAPMRAPTGSVTPWLTEARWRSER